MFGFKKFVIRCRAVIIHDGKMLVVRHPKANFLTLPGGHLEWGEDVKESLSREIIEELGIAPKIGRLLYINNFVDSRNKQSVEFFFEILNSHEYKNIENITRTHAHEIAEMPWIDPKNTLNILPKILGEDFAQGRIISNEVKYINKNA